MRALVAAALAFSFSAAPVEAASASKSVDPKMLPPLFGTEQKAQAHCPGEALVWVDTETGAFHLKSEPAYGNTMPGAYGCWRDASAAAVAAKRIDPILALIPPAYLDELLAQFCAVYKAPAADKNCYPATTFTMLDNHVLGITPLVSCGPKSDDAIANALRSMSRPPMPVSISNIQIALILDEVDTVPPHEKSCALWMRPDGGS